MRIRRVQAEQAHAVPVVAYTARDPFAVRWNPQITVSEDRDIDEGGGWTPPGSNAQNGFKEVKWFRCNECGEILRETHTDSHICEDEQ